VLVSGGWVVVLILLRGDGRRLVGLGAVLLQPLASSHCLVAVSSAEQEEEEGDV